MTTEGGRSVYTPNLATSTLRTRVAILAPVVAVPLWVFRRRSSLLFGAAVGTLLMSLLLVAVVIKDRRTEVVVTEDAFSVAENPWFPPWTRTIRFEDCASFEQGRAVGRHSYYWQRCVLKSGEAVEFRLKGGMEKAWPHLIWNAEKKGVKRVR